jgi:hypothetical protein
VNGTRSRPVGECVDEGIGVKRHANVCLRRHGQRLKVCATVRRLKEEVIGDAVPATKRVDVKKARTNPMGMSRTVHLEQQRCSTPQVHRNRPDPTGPKGRCLNVPSTQPRLAPPRPPHQPAPQQRQPRRATIDLRSCLQTPRSDGPRRPWEPRCNPPGTPPPPQTSSHA